MAKGDHKRVQDMIYDYQDKINSGQENLDNRLNRADDMFYNNYGRGSARDFQSYDNIMNNYQNFFNNPRNPQIGGMSNGYNMYGTTGGNRGFNTEGPMKSIGASSTIPGSNFGSNDPMSQFETELRNYQAANPDAAKSTSGSQLAQYMASKGINISPAMYGNVESGNEVIAPNGEKYKFRVDNGGWYNSSMDDGGGEGFDNSLASYGLGGFGPALQKAISGYSDFADTGGFSGQDIQDLRARAVSPIRSIYSSAKANLDQARNLSGGYMPNYAAANNQMARHMSQDIGDNLVNANAGIASMRNQGRLAGLGGLSGLGQFGAGMANSNVLANMQARSNALAGMSGLYGTSPGMGGTYGNQLLNSGQNLISGQNQRISGAGTLIGGMQNSASIPGNFQSALGNIGSAVNLGASIINPISTIGGKIFGGRGSNYIPSQPVVPASGTTRYF